MARPILDESLWILIEPVLPPPKPRRKKYPGRKPISNRQALTGILFVLKTGIPWEYLPQELGCGSGMTCWRRLRDWQDAGVWDNLHQLALSLLQEEGALDWSVAVADSSSVRAVGAGKKPGQAQQTGAKRVPSIKSGFQASSADRWPRRAAECRADGSQPPRHYPTFAVARCRPQCQQQKRPSAKASSSGAS